MTAARFRRKSPETAPAPPVAVLMTERLKPNNRLRALGKLAISKLRRQDGSSSHPVASGVTLATGSPRPTAASEMAANAKVPAHLLRRSLTHRTSMAYAKAAAEKKPVDTSKLPSTKLVQVYNQNAQYDAFPSGRPSRLPKAALQRKKAMLLEEARATGINEPLDKWLTQQRAAGKAIARKYKNTPKNDAAFHPAFNPSKDPTVKPIRGAYAPAKPYEVNSPKVQTEVVADPGETSNEKMRRVGATVTSSYRTVRVNVASILDTAVKPKTGAATPEKGMPRWARVAISVGAIALGAGAAIVALNQFSGHGNEPESTPRTELTPVATTTESIPVTTPAGTEVTVVSTSTTPTTPTTLTPTTTEQLPPPPTTILAPVEVVPTTIPSLPPSTTIAPAPDLSGFYGNSNG